MKFLVLLIKLESLFFLFLWKFGKIVFCFILLFNIVFVFEWFKICLFDVILVIFGLFDFNKCIEEVFLLYVNLIFFLLIRV